jgi:hypothetical protein
MRKLVLLLGGLAVALVLSAPAKANTVHRSWHLSCAELSGKLHKPWWYAGICGSGGGTAVVFSRPVVDLPDCPWLPGKKHPYKKHPHKTWDKWKKWDKWDKHGKKDHKYPKKHDRDFGKFWPKFDGKKHDRKHYAGMKPGEGFWPKLGGKKHDRKHDSFPMMHGKGKKDFGFKFGGKGGKFEHAFFGGKPKGKFSPGGKFGGFPGLGEGGRHGPPSGLNGPFGHGKPGKDGPGCSFGPIHIGGLDRHGPANWNKGGKPDRGFPGSFGGNPNRDDHPKGHPGQNKFPGKDGGDRHPPQQMPH